MRCLPTRTAAGREKVTKLGGRIYAATALGLVALVLLAGSASAQGWANTVGVGINNAHEAHSGAQWGANPSWGGLGTAAVTTAASWPLTQVCRTIGSTPSVPHAIANGIVQGSAVVCWAIVAVGAYVVSEHFSPGGGFVRTANAPGLPYPAPPSMPYWR